MYVHTSVKDRNQIFNQSRDQGKEGKGDNGDIVKDEDEEEDGQDEVGKVVQRQKPSMKSDMQEGSGQ